MPFTPTNQQTHKTLNLCGKESFLFLWDSNKPKTSQSSLFRILISSENSFIFCFFWIFFDVLNENVSRNIVEHCVSPTESFQQPNKTKQSLFFWKRETKWNWFWGSDNCFVSRTSSDWESQILISLSQNLVIKELDSWKKTNRTPNKNVSEVFVFETTNFIERKQHL
jgi:hypothetical protein